MFLGDPREHPAKDLAGNEAGMMIIRYRWFGPGAPPTIGCYLLARHRPRHGYLVHAVRVVGRRGGLGRPVVDLLTLRVERVPVSEARSGCCFPLLWDRRQRRALRAPRSASR